MSTKLCVQLEEHTENSHNRAISLPLIISTISIYVARDHFPMHIGQSVCHSSFQQSVDMQPGIISLCISGNQFATHHFNNQYICSQGLFPYAYRAICLPLIISTISIYAARYYFPMYIGKSVCHSSFQQSVYMQPGTISLCISGNQFATHHFNNQYICSQGPFPYAHLAISLPLIISTISIYAARDHFPMHIGQSVCHSSFQQSVYMQPGTISLCISGNQFATHYFNNQYICSQGSFPSAYLAISLPLIISTISRYAARDHFTMHIWQSVCHSSFKQSVYMQPGIISLCISGNQFATHHFNNQYICSQGPFPYAYRAISLPLIISTISIYAARDHFPMHIGKSVCHSSFQQSVYMQPGTISLCISGNLFATHHFNNQYICSQGPFPYAYREISLPLIISTISIYAARDNFPMRIGKSVCHSSFQQSAYMQPGIFSLCVAGNQFATHHFNNQYICSQGPFPYAYRKISLPLIISSISIYATRDHFPMRIGKSVCHSSFQQLVYMQLGTISLFPYVYREISLPLIISTISIYMQPGTISICISGNQFATHHFNNQYICSQGPFPYAHLAISLPLIISTISIYAARDYFSKHIGQSVCHSSFQQSVDMQPGTISLCISGNQFATHHLNNQYICSQGPFPNAYREISLPLIISTISRYAARDHFPMHIGQSVCHSSFQQSIYMQPGTISLCVSGNQFATHHLNNQYICSQGPFPYAYREISLPLIISTISIYAARDHFPMHIGQSVCHSSFQQ